MPFVTALSNQSVRDTHATLTDGRLPLRLMGLVIAVLLAVTAGILVISTPHAAASDGQAVLAAAVGEHVHGADSHQDTVHEDHSSVQDLAAVQNDCGDPASEHHASRGTDCCTMGACHAVQTLAAPMLHTPYASAAAIAARGDKQVEGVIPGGLERPPRTV